MALAWAVRSCRNARAVFPRNCYFQKRMYPAHRWTSTVLLAVIPAMLLTPSAGFSASAPPTLVQLVQMSLAQGNETLAASILRDYRTAHGTTPEFLDGASWMARFALQKRNFSDAQKYAKEVYDLAVEQLKKRPLDREPHLPLALGAAVEVQAILLAVQGQRADAVAYLKEQERLYAGTSIVTRLQKNVLLLTLEGKPAPLLDRVTLPKGKPALVFFWAHWCPDCKAEAPILAKIKAEFVPKGLVFIAPTQTYGYAGNGADASPEVEAAYIEQVRQHFYSGVIDGPAPISSTNFRRYGASTTPTLVVIDRAGIVRLYHPGAISYTDLHAILERVVPAS